MKPELHIVPEDGEPRTTTVTRGPYQAIVSEHIDHERVYVAIANGTGNGAAFFEPRAALEIAAALIAAAARALDHQLRRQLGSP